MFRNGSVQFFDELAPLMKPIDSFRQHPENYNNGDVEAIMESIEVNGVWRPMTVQASTGFIAIGNHEWEALKNLGVTEAPFVVEEMDDDHAVRVMLADNRTAALAKPDVAAELALLDRLALTETDLQGTGHDGHSHEVLRHLAEMEGTYDEYGTWPTITIQVPPHVKRAFYDLTDEAVTDADRFELLLRLAGWSP